MVCVGIDVAKDKHDCCILDSDGMVRADCFTIPNNMDGFKQLLQTIRNCTKKSDKIKVGLEATGHYSYNILGFLLDNDLAVYVMNPLHTNLYRKSLSLRKTKPDRVEGQNVHVGSEKRRFRRQIRQPEVVAANMQNVARPSRFLRQNQSGKTVGNARQKMPFGFF